METSCTFSFEDLFWAAHGRPWTRLERSALFDAPQERRNRIVRAWADDAGNVRLEDRIGDDGETYASFIFERPGWWNRLRFRPAIAAAELPASVVGAGGVDGSQAPGPDRDVPVPLTGEDERAVALAATIGPDPGTGHLVGAVTRTGGPLVPGKGVLVSHARSGAELVLRLGGALRGVEGAWLHVADAGDAAPDLAIWLADYLRCRSE